MNPFKYGCIVNGSHFCDSPELVPCGKTALSRFATRISSGGISFICGGVWV